MSRRWRSERDSRVPFPPPDLAKAKDAHEAARDAAERLLGSAHRAQQTLDELLAPRKRSRNRVLVVVAVVIITSPLTAMVARATYLWPLPTLAGGVFVALCAWAFWYLFLASPR